MQLRRLLILAACAALTMIPTLASAQASGAVSPSFLVAGITQAGQQGQPQGQRAPEQQRQSQGSGGGPGFGIGVKAGYLYSSFSSAKNDYKSSSGWQGTLFLGGNRAGDLGVMTELTYAKKTLKQAGKADTDNYYIEVPLLLRMNIGSQNRNTGVSVYFIAGPAVDILLKAKQTNLDVKSNYKDLEWNVIGGVGVEVSRLIIEGRFNWGLQNVLSGPPNELKTKTFALLGGLRFN